MGRNDPGRRTHTRHLFLWGFLGAAAVIALIVMARACRLGGINDLDHVERRTKDPFLSSLEGDIASAGSEMGMPDDPLSGTFPDIDKIVNGSGDHADEIIILDVGQGDAALIVSGTHAALIDTGPQDAAEGLLARLREENIRTLDYLFITHPHMDHYGNANQVLANFTVKGFVTPVTEDEAYFWNVILQEAGRQNIPVTVPLPGNTFTVGNFTLIVLAPVPEVLAKDQADADEVGDEFDPNEGSLALLVTDKSGKFSFLIYGDGEESIEHQIATSPYLTGGLDVLHVAHHGSSISTGEELLSALKPDTPHVAVISAGKGNEYGHPAQSVLNRLADYGYDVIRTDEQGEVRIIIDNSGSHVIR